MTVPAALSVAAATLGLSVALLSWRLSRAPGWKQTRHFAVVSATAGIYCICEAFSTVHQVSDDFFVWVSRFALAAAAFHGPAWVLYIAAQERRPSRSWERGLQVVGGLVAVLSMIPDCILSDRVTYREVTWVGATYRDVATTNIGAAVYAVYCAMLLIPISVYLRRAIARKPAAVAHVVGLFVLVVCAVNDSFVGAGVLSHPYALSLGFLIAILMAGGVMLDRFLAQARAFEMLSQDLGSQVRLRTDELAETQAALLQAEKLAALGRLAAGAAHELNNPCSVVNTNLAYLEHMLVKQGRVPEDLSRCLDESMNATDRIAKIIGHLVDAGRMGGTANVEPSRFSVFEMTEKAVICARVGLESCPRFDVVGDESAEAFGDPTLFQQIIVNLAINAAHAVERRAEGRVRLDVYQDEDRVIVDVVDNGEGIGEAEVQNIFEPFFTTKRPGHGMGLGLAVSLGLARAQGGDIVVASTGPSGTTMRVRLSKSNAGQSMRDFSSLK